MKKYFIYGYKPAYTKDTALDKLSEIARKYASKDKTYIIAVGYYHIDNYKIGFYSYFGIDKKSCSNLVWTSPKYGVQIKRINNTHCALKISEKQLNFLKIDISKCEILFEL